MESGGLHGGGLHRRLQPLSSQPAFPLLAQAACTLLLLGWGLWWLSVNCLLGLRMVDGVRTDLRLRRPADGWRHGQAVPELAVGRDWLASGNQAVRPKLSRVGRRLIWFLGAGPRLPLITVCENSALGAAQINKVMLNVNLGHPVGLV